jgi:hypothetical protein
VASLDLTQASTMAGEVEVDLGAGNDIGSMRSIWMVPATRDPYGYQVVSLLGGGGHDNLFVHTSFATAPGQTVFGEVAWHLRVDAGAGNDFVDVRGDSFGPPGALTGHIAVDVWGREGNDVLRVTWPDMGRVDFAGLVDGGTGFDLAIASEKFAVRNCEG